MAATKTDAPRIAIVGGGISGLAAAYRLEQLIPDAALTLFESTASLGGKIVTHQSDGFVIEEGPDCFLARKPRGIGLCEELGIAGELIGRIPEQRRTYVRREGLLHRLPEGLTGLIPTNLSALMESTLFSSAGAQRVAQEAAIPPARLGDEDESVASFVRRRFGDEAWQWLIEPLMSGIYAGDGEQLSILATFPQLRTLEQKHGSVLAGLQQASPAGDAQHPPFVAFPGGMQRLVAAVSAALRRTHIRYRSSVKAIVPQRSGYTLEMEEGLPVTVDALILATPATVSTRLLAQTDPELAALHASIPHASSATISLAFDEAQIPQLPIGYGYVIPRAEQTDLLACTWTSQKWAGRTPDGSVLLRVYIGRYGRRDVTLDSDQALVAQACMELKNTLGIEAAPERVLVARWPNGMPQYVLGHRQRILEIETQMSRHRGLALAGAAYHGVGIPDCIHSGEQAARSVAAALEKG